MRKLAGARAPEVFPQTLEQFSELIGGKEGSAEPANGLKPTALIRSVESMSTMSATRAGGIRSIRSADEIAVGLDHGHAASLLQVVPDQVLQQQVFPVPVGPRMYSPLVEAEG